MGGLVLGGAFALAALLVVGVLVALISLVFWVLFLPFRLLGLVFRGVAALLLLPFLLLLAIAGPLIFGVGFLVFLVPGLPLILLALAAWWLWKRHDDPHGAVGGASR